MELIRGLKVLLLFLSKTKRTDQQAIIIPAVAARSHQVERAKCRREWCDINRAHCPVGTLLRRHYRPVDSAIGNCGRRNCEIIIRRFFNFIPLIHVLARNEKRSMDLVIMLS